MLRIQNFSKSFFNRTILSISSLDLAPGMYWFKGINGSGKSTLFKSICGIIPFQGSIELNQWSVKKHPVAYRQRISFSEAEPNYPDFLSLRDLITFTAKAKKATKQQQISLIDQFNGADFMHQPVNTYSSGMLKKSSLLLAFLGQPQLVVLDEPFTTIDHQTVHQLMQLIGQYHDQFQTTFLISSHVEKPPAQLYFNHIYHIENATINLVI
ncbi:MAG: ABC transporter ATP-binding protein [Candidatus Cyclobacteriaceae bacterium M3_2C_046]